MYLRNKLLLDVYISKMIFHSCSFSSIVAKQREDFVNGLIMISGGGPIPLAPEMGVFSLPKFFLKLLEKPVKKEFFRLT